jgi:hypothetical protein
VYTNMRVYPRHINASRKKLSDPPHRLPSVFAAPQQLLATRGLGARLRIWGSFELVRWSLVGGPTCGRARGVRRAPGGGGGGRYVQKRAKPQISDNNQAHFHLLWARQGCGACTKTRKTSDLSEISDNQAHFDFHLPWARQGCGASAPLII